MMNLYLMNLVFFYGYKGLKYNFNIVIFWIILYFI
jgi:hypothetical protein